MSRLTHLDDAGNARMVDVGEKPVTRRAALATGSIGMSAEALSAIREGTVKKGDVLATARIAGIMAAKRTGDLIPLCHPLPIDGVTVEFEFGENGIAVSAIARTSAKTGVEMEAIIAASIALLTIYDMAKAIDKAMVITGVRLLAKDGGKSGRWRAEGCEGIEI
ncbi:cyclic pyranopterin monophosphate synthase MoaC [Croceicoccus bisphenolivorans]|uniref:cyclic pyranopterin monophosphate synthase MoaC n=1 Tax=Croceicoccus bisphenolivorans TaxID=1783232 RepID=UPI00083279EC|nr:cyclic pyranopterin monophosphate synthase MoaC [Croceicoccus bisphenolivorans]